MHVLLIETRTTNQHKPWASQHTAQSAAARKATLTAAFGIIPSRRCQEGTMSKKEKKARKSLISDCQDRLTIQHLAFKNPSIISSAAFCKAELSHLLTSSLFKWASVDPSSALISQLSMWYRETLQLQHHQMIFVTWYCTEVSSRNVWELFKMQDSPKRKKRLVLQRQKNVMWPNTSSHNFQKLEKWLEAENWQ